jgi:uncharacterized membrane protein YccC
VSSESSGVTYFATVSKPTISPSLSWDAARSEVSATCSHPCAGGDKGLARVITFEELGAKLSDLEEIRTTAVEKLEAIRNYQERIEEMEKDRDALLESYALRAPEALNNLTPEERHQVYRMLRLRAAVRIGGTLEVSGMFGEGSGFCHSEVRSSTQ